MKIINNFIIPEHSDDQKDLIISLCDAQGEFPIIDKNKSGRFKYADLPQVVHMTRPILVNHGLAIAQDFMCAEGSRILISTLLHKSGQFRESVFLLPDRQQETIEKGGSLNSAIGGDITYYKRYTYCAMLGIVTSDEDYDGDPVPERSQAPERPQLASEPQVNLLKNLVNDDANTLNSILKKENITDLNKISSRSASYYISALQARMKK